MSAKFNFNVGGTDPVKGTSFTNGIIHNASVTSYNIYRWDARKHNELCEKYFGNTLQVWDNRNPEDVENFLREYYEDSGIILDKIEKVESHREIPLHWKFYFNRQTR